MGCFGLRKAVKFHALCLLLMLIAAGAAGQEPFSVKTKDGRVLSLNTKTVKNAPHIPLPDLSRFLEQAIGYKTDWDETFGVLKITKGAENFSLFLDKAVILHNTQIMHGTQSVLNESGEILIPLSSFQMLAEIWGEFAIQGAAVATPPPPQSTPAPAPASTSAAATSPSTKPPSGGVMRVIIDPATEPFKSKRIGNEKTKPIAREEWTLSLARRLKASLEQEGGFEAVLTTAEGEKPTIEEKIKRINNSLSAALVALRLEESEFESLGGIEVVVASSALDMTADKSRAERGLSAGAAAVYIPRQSESQNLAAALVEELERATGSRTGPVMPSPAYLLKRVSIPAVIISCGYVSNPSDNINLAKDSYQESLVRAITDALKKFKNLKK